MRWKRTIELTRSAILLSTVIGAACDRSVGRTSADPIPVPAAGPAAAAQESAPVATAASGRRNTPPQIPMVFPDKCPGEFCTFGEWLACRTLAVRSAERTDAPTLFTLERNEPFTALTGNLHVVQAGMVVFHDTVRVSQIEGGGPPHVFTPADTLYPLYYEGEGDSVWWVHGRMEGGGWYFQADRAADRPEDKLTILRPWRSQWWVRVRNQRAQEGWVAAGDSLASFVGMAPSDDGGPMRCPGESERD